MGAKVLTLSDSSGFIHDPAGINKDKLKYVMQLKNEQRGRISEYEKNIQKLNSLLKINHGKWLVILQSLVLLKTN